MFFGSVLAHVTATLIPGASENPSMLLAAREAISMANWYVTIPGLVIAILSGIAMAIYSGYEKRHWLVLHALAVAVVTVNAAVVLIPAALELEAGARAVVAGTMRAEVLAGTEMRESMFGAGNITIIIIAIAIGVALPSLRKSRS
jgi:hypothetical protein